MKHDDDKDLQSLKDPEGIALRGKTLIVELVTFTVTLKFVNMKSKRHSILLNEEYDP